MHQARGNESNYVKKKAIGTKKRPHKPFMVVSHNSGCHEVCLTGKADAAVPEFACAKTTVCATRADVGYGSLADITAR